MLSKDLLMRIKVIFFFFLFLGKNIAFLSKFRSYLPNWRNKSLNLKA